MLVEIKEVAKVDRFNREFKHELFVLECDVCHKQWETRGSKVRITSRKTHSCSLECKKDAHRNGGVIERQRAVTCIERYGAENPFAAESCKSKMRTTWKEKYGTEHARSSDVVKDKVKATMIERYGAEHPSQVPEIRKKQVDSLEKNWGTKDTWNIPHVRQALVNGCIKKFGAPQHMMNREHAKEVLEKRAREGTLYQSKPENKFYELLCEKFGPENVQRQVVMNNGFWSIDFYVTSLDAYSQFDGVYWHGLDRPIDVIKESGQRGHRRDAAIYRKWIVDRQQDTWFTAQGKRLVRISDREFTANSAACLLRIAS